MHVKNVRVKGTFQAGYWKIVCRNFTYSFAGERAGDKDFYLRLVSRKLVNMYAGNLNFDSDFTNEIYDPSILRLEWEKNSKVVRN